MMSENKKTHWEQVYQTKAPDQVSWTQAVPQTSLDFIHSFNLPKNSKIIDIGGGDSKLADYLLQEGFTDITVLDISQAALEKAKIRLGRKSKKVKWIVSDITSFQPKQTYDVWHDRATFHFLTEENQIAAYLGSARKAIANYLVIGTFAENGPDKCSGLPVKRYSETQLQNQLDKGFAKIRCVNEDHVTPFQTKQSFLFCGFKRSSAV
jgi:SAM-dependent methyltransferase